MAEVAANEFNQNFLDILELWDLNYSMVMDCRAKACELYVKAFSDQESAVFGSYQLTVLYKKSYVGDDKNFATYNVRKNICMKIPYAAAQNAQAELLLEPVCPFRYEGSTQKNAAWRVQIKGKIRIFRAAEEEAPKEEECLKEEEPSPSSGEKPNGAAEMLVESDTLQFEENEDFPMEQLLEMDLDSLKKLKEQKKL